MRLIRAKRTEREVLSTGVGGVALERPLSLLEAKSFLGVATDDTDHDTNLTNLLKQAEELVSRYVGEPLVTHLVDEFYPQWGDGLSLHGTTTEAPQTTPLVTLEVAYHDTNRNEQTLTIGTDVFLDNTGRRDAIRYLPAFNAPQLFESMNAPIRVSYTGLARTSETWGGETIKTCIQIYLSQLFPQLPGERTVDLKALENNIANMLTGLD